MAKRTFSYVVSKVPENMKDPANKGKTIYYCHQRQFPSIPVFGSIGNKAKAQAVCDAKNGIPASERRRVVRNG